jgi:predicted outer membrane protein
MPFVACGVLILIPMVGCATADNDADDTTTARSGAATEDSTSSARASSVRKSPTAGTQTGSETESEAARTTLDDGEILGVMKAVNEGEVVAGQLAAQKATMVEVREFAQDMVHDHSAGKQQVEQTAAAATPVADSPMADKIAKDVNRSSNHSARSREPSSTARTSTAR